MKVGKAGPEPFAQLEKPREKLTTTLSLGVVSARSITELAGDTVGFVDSLDGGVANDTVAGAIIEMLQVVWGEDARCRVCASEWF